MDEKINSLKSEIEKTKKHPRIPAYVVWVVIGAFIVFLIGMGVYFSSNSNQIKLTITNGSEIIKRLEVRAENAENAQIQDRDSIEFLNQHIVNKAEEFDSIKNVLQKQVDKKDKNIKELNEKVDSLLRIVNTYQHSDIEPVKRDNQ